MILDSISQELEVELSLPPDWPPPLLLRTDLPPTDLPHTTVTCLTGTVWTLKSTHSFLFFT